MNGSILIVGTGALATFFAARLSAAGIDVTVLGSWMEGLTSLQVKGARIDDEPSQKVRAVSSPMECKGIRYALVLVKSWQTEKVADQLAACLPSNGLAVTLQNGLGNDDVLAHRLGNAHVSQGLTTIGVTLNGPGCVHLGGEGIITLETHPQIALVAEYLRIANFVVDMRNDIKPQQWGKLVLNSAINPVSAILQLKNGELLGNDHARNLMASLAQEAVTVANASGVNLPYSDPLPLLDEITCNTADNYSSMAQDLMRGSETEIDAINGSIIKIAQEEGIFVPYNRGIYLLIKAFSVRGKI